METISTTSPRRTVQAGVEFAARLKVGDCVELTGPLGAGKTVFVRGVAEGLGADVGLVSSPTFVLVQEYPGRLTVYHIDLYRITGGGRELLDLGLEEMLREGVVLIEWAEKARDALPHGRWRVEIAPTGPRRRRIGISRVD